MKRQEYRRREQLMQVVQETLPAVPLPNVSECKARCVKLSGSAKKDCEDDCDAWEAIAVVAARLRRTLVISFHDVIWGGGDIDPVPDPFALEQAVRERFNEKLGDR